MTGDEAPNLLYLVLLIVLVGSSLVAMRLPVVGSSRVDLQACKLEYSIVSPK